MEQLRGKLDTFRLILGLIKDSSDCDNEMLDQLSAEISTITREITLQYKDCAHDINVKVLDDPSIQYFGIDWRQTFWLVEGFQDLLQKPDPPKSELESLIVTFNRIEREVSNHIIAVRSGRLKLRKLREQETFQRRLAMVARSRITESKPQNFHRITKFLRNIF